METVHLDQSPEWMAVPPAIKQKVVEVEYCHHSLISMEVERQASWECAACDFLTQRSGAELDRSAANVMRHAEQRYILITVGPTLNLAHSVA